MSELDELHVVNLATVRPQRVEWLWPGYLPVGKLVILDGDPGLGKSTLALDLTARITTGSPMPDGTPLRHEGAVIILSAEDGIADTIRPRLDAAGADPRYVDALEAVSTLDDNGNTATRLPILPLDVARLGGLVRKRAARLVAVDVLAAYLDAGVNSHRDQDVRRALHPLAKMADDTGATVLVLRHLNKSTGTHALYRGGGSIGMSGAARAVLMVGVDPDDEGRNVLAVVKSNLAAVPPALAYRLVGDEQHGCARVAWEGPTGHRADDLVRGDDADERSAHGDAVAFLKAVLEEGPVRSSELLAQARKSGIAETTLRRAKRRLGVRSYPGGFGEPWLWALS